MNNQSNDERAYRDTEVMPQQNMGRMGSAVANPDLYNYLINKRLEGKNGIYNIKSYFAEGGEAVLFECTNDSIESSIYIAKIYVKRQMSKSMRKKYIDFLYRNNCAGIVPLLDFGVHNDIEFDVFPFIEKGDISQIKNMSIMYITKTLVPQINEILRCIHSNGLVHGDINPRNILLDDGNNILLHDFTSLNYVGNKKRGAYVRDAQATYGYAAPEVLGMVQYAKSDYYALGITLLYYLNYGIDIYEGIEPETIREKTIGDEIPGIDREYFKSYCQKNNLTSKEKLLGLIHGLTIHNVNFRWGYEEVEKWCKGELVFPVYIDEKGDCLNPAFVWKEKKIQSLEEMAVTLAKDWNNAKIANERGTFRDFFASQRADLRYEIDDILLKNYSDTGKLDIDLFRVIYTIAPKLPCIYWKGIEYDDFCAMASAFQDMLPQYDEEFILVLKEGILTEYLNKREAYDQNFNVDPIIKKQLQDIEQYASIDGRIAYNMFLMQFLPEDELRTFCIDKTIISSYLELIDYIEITGQELQTKAYSILYDPVFAAWIWKNGGFYYLIRAKQGVVDKCEEWNKAYVNLMIMLDNILPEKYKRNVRSFVLKHNYLDYVIRLKRNLDMYDYNTDQALAVRDKFEKTVLDESISVNQIFKNLNMLYDEYIKFSKLASNPFDVINGICYTKPEILPKNALGCFVYDNQIKAMYEESECYKKINVERLMREYNQCLSGCNKINKTYYKHNMVRLLYYIMMIVAFYKVIPILNIKPHIANAATITGMFFPITQIIYVIKNIKEGCRFDIFIKKIKTSIKNVQIWNEKSRSKSEALYVALNNSNYAPDIDNANYGYLKAKNDELMLYNMVIQSKNPGKYLIKLRVIAYKITGCVIAGLFSLGAWHLISLVVGKYQLSEISKAVAIVYGTLSFVCLLITLDSLDEPHGIKLWLFTVGTILATSVVIVLLSIIRFVLNRLLLFIVLSLVIIGVVALVSEYQSMNSD